MQELLDTNSALIDYFLGEENLYIWLVTRHFIKCELVKIKRDDLIGQIKNLRQPFVDLKLGRIRSITEMNFDIDSSHRLYQILFEPIEKHIPSGIKKLVIVPQSALHFLPFEALVSSFNDEATPNKVL